MKMDRQKLGSMLLALAQTLGGELTPAALELYAVALEELTELQLARALRRALRESKFMPRPGELFEFAQEQSAGDRAIVAWTEVQAAIAKHGAYTSVDFEDPAINAAVRGMGGWSAVCSMPKAEADVWGRKEFERQYSAFARALPAELAAPLAGITEQHNNGRGLPSPPAVRVPASTPFALAPAPKREPQLQQSAPAAVKRLAAAMGGVR
jgi:hypothetical protein